MTYLCVFEALQSDIIWKASLVTWYPQCVRPRSHD